MFSSLSFSLSSHSSRPLTSPSAPFPPSLLLFHLPYSSKLPVLYYPIFFFLLFFFFFILSSSSSSSSFSSFFHHLLPLPPLLLLSLHSPIFLFLLLILCQLLPPSHAPHKTASVECIIDPLNDGINKSR